jgi:hypothetical protein
MRNKDPNEGGREMWDTVMMAKRGYIGTQRGRTSEPEAHRRDIERSIQNDQTADKGETGQEEGRGREEDAVEPNQRRELRGVVGEPNQGIGNRGRNAGGGNRRNGQGNRNRQMTPERALRQGRDAAPTPVTGQMRGIHANMLDLSGDARRDGNPAGPAQVCAGSREKHFKGPSSNNP